MNDTSDNTTPASALTLNVKRIRTHVRGGGGSGDGMNSAAGRKPGSLPPRPHEAPFQVNVVRQYGY